MSTFLKGVAYVGGVVVGGAITLVVGATLGTRNGLKEEGVSMREYIDILNHLQAKAAAGDKVAAERLLKMMGGDK